MISAIPAFDRFWAGERYGTKRQVVDFLCSVVPLFFGLLSWCTTPISLWFIIIIVIIYKWPVFTIAHCKVFNIHKVITNTVQLWP